MGSGLLGTPGSGFCIILCLPVLDLSNLSDVSLFQEHLDRAIFRGEKRAWLFGKESSAVWHYQSRGHRAARKLRTALPCPARGEAALLLTSPSTATCFSTLLTDPPGLLFCLRSAASRALMVGQGSLPSRLPAWYSQTLLLSGHRSDTFLPWPPRQPKEVDPSGLRCQANWDHVDLLCARLDMRHSEKMRVACNPRPLIFTAEWTKDRHKYCLALADQPHIDTWLL